MVLAVPAVPRRVRAPVARVVPAVGVVPARIIRVPSVTGARPAVRAVLVAPVVTLWREPRVTAVLLVPVVTVVTVPTARLATSLASLALPVVRAVIAER